MMEEKTIKTKGIYEGKIINLRVDTIKLPDGREATRRLLSIPEALRFFRLMPTEMFIWSGNTANRLSMHCLRSLLPENLQG